MLDLTLQPGSSQPLYLQVYESIATQIRTGRLRAGDRLPGKRSLASHLAIAINTVDTAYQMLVAEGYLESRERSGFCPALHRHAEIPRRPAVLRAGTAERPRLSL